MATSPGDKASKGKASLISRLFIASITLKKAKALNIALINKMIKGIDRLISNGASKKNGIEKIRVITDTKNEKSSASILERTFFSEMAAKAEKTAEMNAK